MEYSDKLDGMPHLSLENYFHEYLRIMKFELQYSSYTLQAYEGDFEEFLSFCRKKNITRIGDLNRSRLREWQHELRARALKSVSISRKLSALRSFFGTAFENGWTATDLGKFFTSPKKEKKLPKFLFESELVKILGEPLSDEFWDLRDYLILEFLYCTGLRVGELASLTLQHFGAGFEAIRVKGKGQKERNVFLTRGCIANLRRYLEQRAQIVDKKNDFCFISKRKQALSIRGIQFIVGNYLDKVGLHKKISPHVLRHSFATHLINAGADIRAVQELLGHASLATTQIYTHISKGKMRDVVKNCHPRG